MSSPLMMGGFTSLSGAQLKFDVTRRSRTLAFSGAAGAVPLILALGYTINQPQPNALQVAVVLVGSIAILALVLTTRYELALVGLALYFGLLNGPIKLETSSGWAVSALRDAFIAALCVGMISRLVPRWSEIRLPPLSGWVIAYVVLVLAEAFNPATAGFLKALGGFRQLLEWIPFFFFGFAVLRTKRRLRVFLLILAAVACANGIVSTVQTQVSPQQLETWGPGYKTLVSGERNGISSRTYFTPKERRVRPPALGSDIGFGGFVGVLALPAALALLPMGASGRKLIVPLLLCVGTLLAILTSLQRSAVLGAVAAVAAFGVLAVTARGNVGRSLRALLLLVLIGAALSLAASGLFQSDVFSRYASIKPANAASTAYNYRIGSIEEIPTNLTRFPFGGGLATTSAAAGYGGRVSHDNVRDASYDIGESQYNELGFELGAPGLILWVGLTLNVILLASRSIPKLGDTEIKLSLAAIFAAVIAYSLMGFGGPTSTALPFGPFFWLAVGVASYWFKTSHGNWLLDHRSAAGNPISLSWRQSTEVRQGAGK